MHPTVEPDLPLLFQPLEICEECMKNGTPVVIKPSIPHHHSPFDESSSNETDGQSPIRFDNTENIESTSYMVAMESTDSNGQMQDFSYSMGDNTKYQTQNNSYPIYQDASDRNFGAVLPGGPLPTSEYASGQIPNPSNSVSAGYTNDQVAANSCAISGENWGYQYADTSSATHLGGRSGQTPEDLGTISSENENYLVPDAWNSMFSGGASNQTSTTPYMLPLDLTCAIFSEEFLRTPAMPEEFYAKIARDFLDRVPSAQNLTGFEALASPTAVMRQAMSPARVRLYLKAECLHHPRPNYPNRYKKILYAFPSRVSESPSYQAPGSRNPTPVESFNSRPSSRIHRGSSGRSLSSQQSAKIERAEVNLDADDSLLRSELSRDRVSLLIEEAQLERFSSPEKEPTFEESEFWKGLIFIPDINPEEFVAQLSTARFSPRGPKNGYGRHGVTFMQPLRPIDFVLRDGAVDPEEHNAVFMPPLGAEDFMEVEDDLGEGIVLEGYRHHGGMVFVQHVAGGKPGVIIYEDKIEIMLDEEEGGMFSNLTRAQAEELRRFYGNIEEDALLGRSGNQPNVKSEPSDQSIDVCRQKWNDVLVHRMGGFSESIDKFVK